MSQTPSSRAADVMRTRWRETYGPSATLLPELGSVGWSVFSKAVIPGLGPHVHEQRFEICYIVRGTVDWWIEDRMYEVQRGEVFVTQPGERHGGVGSVMHPCELYWMQVTFGAGGMLGLSAPQTRQLHEAFLNLKVRCFPGSDHLPGLYRRMLTEHRAPAEHSAVAVQGVLLQLLVDVLRDGWRYEHQLKGRPARSSPMERAAAYIDQHLGQPLSLEELAEVAGMGPSHFRQQFAREMGFPPGQYVLRRRIRRAKELLRDRRYSVTRMANLLGFSSSQHFATTFKKWVGLTPTEYRGGEGKDLAIW